MPRRKSYIEQATIFDQIGEPKGYAELTKLQKHYLRQTAKGVYDLRRAEGLSHKFAASLALERMPSSVAYYARQNAENARNARCGATAKGTGKPCRMKPIEGRKRCKYHGGLSTGPKTLDGRIKALSGLKQYKARPDLLAARIAELARC